MKYIFFDTETSGLPVNYGAKISESDNWPRLVQIAWSCADKDGETWMEESVIIKPDGFTIPEDASNVHGITTERAMDEGKDLKETLEDFNAHVETHDIIVAHNITFDRKIVAAEYYRMAMQEAIDTIYDTEKICTMMKSTKYCNLPKPSGRGGAKWPKLEELYRILFDKEMVGAHDALADIQATAKCFWELKRLGIIEVEEVAPTTTEEDLPKPEKVQIKDEPITVKDNVFDEAPGDAEETKSGKLPPTVEGQPPGFGKDGWGK